MSEIKDDPREVLVLLNSLGFVGITAIQLKAFMKDLKIYRKVRERERQQQKEEIKTKIINKQQTLLRKAYRHHDAADYSLSNIIPSESSNSLDDESVVKVRIRCISKEEDVQKQRCFKANVIKSDEKLSQTKRNKQDAIEVAESNRIYCEQNYSNTKSYPVIKSSKSETKQISKCLTKNNHLAERCKQNLKIDEQMKPMTSIHPSSAPVLSNYISQLESKSVTSDPTGNIRTQSALSAKSSVNFGPKSFIRPWRLQSEIQKNIINKKCDPVALYQKYQQEWKRISFPGEAKHSKVRWAVREKMLGTDPHPMPLSKKSTYTPILKRK
ncbi:PREDICTED: uncharacterized protein LOC105152140 [Acromyrmex echinatior]|uniref:Centriolar and ciliogenesis-associated protein HYLS1 C-terminal domain-containing protein n=1 Tax=Acromyrmex echinatior TaxID=103372 RepID=F4X2X7_ACREC|nr:PREDICTED: uncharacterized protein LOC105152140 [Acromyrmex echinatior]EGI59198.1 hypothetical protein G5I_12660 [Acromyrmex echinatior]